MSSKQRNKLIAIALAGACAYGAYEAGKCMFGSEAQGTEYAVNQVWIDHVPQDDRDMIAHMVLIDHRQGQFGAIGRSSQWRHMIDVFRWQLDRGTLRVFFPQDRVRGEVGVRTWECKGEAPAPFELCMELTNQNGNSAMLYSRKDWKVEPRNVDGSLEDIAADNPELAGVLRELDEVQVDAVLELDLDEAESWTERVGLGL